jgi:heme/copper-type cytochrome/quinol oxidase subunit 2
MFRRFVSIMTVALLALVVLAACGGGDDEGEEAGHDVTRVPAEGAPPMPASEGSPAAGGEEAAGGQQPPAGGGEQAAAGAPITIEGVDIAWVYNGQRSAPGQGVPITAAPGTTISLPNTGATLHNFAVDALGIDVDMPVGETVEATIPADAAPGEYEYYCNVPGHKQAGMAGTLIVQ